MCRVWKLIKSTAGEERVVWRDVLRRRRSPLLSGVLLRPCRWVFPRFAALASPISTLFCSVSFPVLCRGLESPPTLASGMALLITWPTECGRSNILILPRLVPKRSWVFHPSIWEHLLLGRSLQAPRHVDWGAHGARRGHVRALRRLSWAGWALCR